MLTWVSAHGYFSVYRLVRMLKSEEKTIILTPYFIFSIRGTTRTLKAALIIRQLGARRNFFQDVISNQTVVCSIIEIQCNRKFQSEEIRYLCKDDCENHFTLQTGKKRVSIYTMRER